MTALARDIAAFDEMRIELEAKHQGEWVVFHRGKCFGFFSDFELAAERAVDEFDAGPYLIRQIGAPPVQLPCGMVFTPKNSLGQGRY